MTGASRTARRRMQVAALGVALACALVRNTASAQTWTGGGANSNWSTGLNWNTGVAPVNNGTASVIMAGSTRPTPSVDAPWSILGLTFNNTAGAFTLSGSALTLQGNGFVNNSANTQTINNDIVMPSGNPWTATSGNLVLGGVISGTGGPTKSGPFLLTLTGTNTFTGILSVAVNGGPLTIQNGSALGATGPTNYTLINSGGAVQLLGDITTAEPFQLLGDGVSGTGSLRSLSGNNTITGTILLWTSSTLGADIGSLTLSGVISQNSAGLGLTKVGAGTVVLSGANSYSGPVAVNAGVLNVQHATALGTVAGGVTVAGGAALQLQGGIAVGAEALTLNGSGVAGDGALRNLVNNNSWSGAVALGSPATIASDAGTLTLSGIISGLGGLTKSGTGTLTLSGASANTFTGALTVNDGTVLLSKTAGLNALAGTLTVGDGLGGAAADVVRLTAANQIPAVTVSVNNSGLLDLNGNADAIGALSMTGGSVTTGAGTLTLGGDVTGNADAGTASITGTLALGGNRTFTIADGAAAVDMSIAAVISGANTLGKAGTGTLALSGANTYSNTTTVSAGTLLVNNVSGSGTGSGGVSVNAGATLGGTGTISGAVTLNGTIAPGASPGTLNTGPQTWNSGGAYLWEVNKADGTRGADPGWDWTSITGTLTIAATSASPFTIRITSLDLTDVAGQAAAFNSTQSYVWTIATASGGISGFAANKFILDASALQNPANGGTFAISVSGNNLNLTFTPGTRTLSGTVFEDRNYGGGAGRSLAASGGLGVPGARVELYDNAGNFLAAATTNGSGAYTLSSLAAGSYTLRVVNDSVRSARTGYTTALKAVQTFRDTASSGTTLPDNDRVGGENPALVDAPANTTNASLSSLNTGTTTAQSVAPVAVSTANITGMDFGFNFDLVVNTNDAGQGSLRQFILNSNALTGEGSLAQAGFRKDSTNTSQALPTGLESSIFMIPGGTVRAGLRAGLASQLSGSGVAVITIATQLPQITGTATSLDATTQTVNVGDTNPGLLGTGGTVGVDHLPLSQVYRPEVQLVDGLANLRSGLDLNASNVTVRGFSIYGFGTQLFNSGDGTILVEGGTGIVIEENVIGTPATSFTDPGASRSNGEHIWLLGGTGSIHNNLIAFATGSGVDERPGAPGWTIGNNEFRGNSQGSNFFEGIILSASGNTVIGNLVIANRGSGLDIYGSTATNLFRNNTVTGSGTASPTNETPGFHLDGTGGLVEKNVINANFGGGVLVAATASGIVISQNSIYANGTILNEAGGGPSGQIGIDLLNAGDVNARGSFPFVTVNDNGDLDTGGNGLFNFPIIALAYVDAGNLTLTGFARPGTKIEFFLAAADPTGYGQGQTYLFTTTEGCAVVSATCAAVDADAGTGSYSIAYGTIAAPNIDNTNRFRFTLPVPGGVGSGSLITATGTDATLGTSEFSGTVAVMATGTIAGTVFEDVNYGGGAGRDALTANGSGRVGARIELYDSTGAFVKSATTNATGQYSLVSVLPGRYTVRVVNDSVSSSRAGYTTALKAVQTFRDTASSGTALPDVNRVGGENPALSDAAANTTNATLASLTSGSTTAQSIAPVTVGNGAAVASLDFGFSFDVVVNTGNAAQGSLRQFLLNANALGGDGGLMQAGLVAGKENAVFMISNGSASAGLRAANNFFTGGAATIVPLTPLPVVSTVMVLDAQRQPGWAGAPVIELNGASVAANNSGLILTAGSSIVRGFVINRFVGSNTNAAIMISGPGGNTIQGNYLGASAAGTASSPNYQGIRIDASTGNLIGGTTAAQQNVISGNQWRGILVTNGASGNLIRGNYIGPNASGSAALANQVIGVYLDESGTNTVGGTGAGEGNVISGNTQIGVYLVYPAATGNLIQGNTIGLNAARTAPVANGISGVEFCCTGNPPATNTVGGAAAGAGNVIAGNGSYGIRIWDGTGNTIQGNTINANGLDGVQIRAGTGNGILANSIYGDGALGIDLGSNDAVTPNDGAKNGTLPNSDMDFPVFTGPTPSLSGTTLSVTGYVGTAPGQAVFAGARVEIFKSDNDPSGNGEGPIYLGFLMADGTGRFSGTLTVSGLAVGDRITGTATDASNNTSEFGLNALVGGPPPLVSLTETVSPGGTLPPGTDLVYTISFGNTGGSSASSLVLVDSLRANVDFKLGSVTSSLGSTGLGVAVAYSNDGGATFTYAPVSGGGGAPPGYDRNVTHVRWTFTGNLSQLAPNNAGSVGLTARIR